MTKFKRENKEDLKVGDPVYADNQPGELQITWIGDNNIFAGVKCMNSGAEWDIMLRRLSKIKPQNKTTMNEQEEIEFFVTRLRNMTLPAELPSCLEHLKDAYKILKEELLLAKESKNDHQYDELINAFEKNLKTN